MKMEKIIVCLQNLPNRHMPCDILDAEEADRAACAAALDLKDSSDCQVMMLSAGNVRSHLALGGDEGVKIELKKEPDEYGLACVFAEAVKRLGGADLILIGACSKGMTASLLGGMLDLPNTGPAVRLLAAENGLGAGVEEEPGFETVYELTLPAVVSVAPRAYKNVYSTVNGIIRAEALEIKILSDIPMPEPLIETVSIVPKERTKKCSMIAGSTFEAAEALKKIVQGFRITE